MNPLAQAVPAAWQPLAQLAMQQPEWAALAEFLAQEQAAGQIIYPAPDNWFAALRATTPAQVRVVIVGQDPYHGAGEAHGLSFSVPHGVRIPPSLANIFKEIARDLDINPPQHGCLQSWAEQGVLLLNSSLTVRADQAGSHAKAGWQPFTDALIAGLAATQSHIVFMLWGAHAQKKATLIDPQQHLVLKSVHPSPLSAYRGFIGCGHFSAANIYLQQQGRAPIDWSLPV